MKPDQTLDLASPAMVTAYDERIGRVGTGMFEVKELRLADTFPHQPSVTFQKGRDNLDEIGGMVTVGVVSK